MTLSSSVLFTEAMLKILLLDKRYDLLAVLDLVNKAELSSLKDESQVVTAEGVVLKDGAAHVVALSYEGVLTYYPAFGVFNCLRAGEKVNHSFHLPITLHKKMKEHLSRLSLSGFRISNDASTIVSKDIEWYPLETAPLGAKVWALTTGHISLSTILTKDTLKYYLGWYPIPKEPPWIKGKGLGYPPAAK